MPSQSTRRNSPGAPPSATSRRSTGGGSRTSGGGTPRRRGSSRQVSPVPKFLLPETVRGSLGRSPVFGLRPSVLLAPFAPPSSSSRTSPSSGPGDSTKSYLAYPRQGWTRNGRQLAPENSVLLMSGRGCSLLPTPVARSAVVSLVNKKRTKSTWEKTSELTGRLKSLVLGLRGHEPAPRERYMVVPEFVEWMMGLPIGFTEISSGSEASGTPSSRRSSPPSSKRSSGPAS